MAYMLDFLARAGLDGAVLSLGYLPDPIKEYFDERDLDGFTIDYAVEDSALGTAGGIKNAEKYLDGDTFVVVNGDVLSGMDLRVPLAKHKESDALATIVLVSVEDPTAYGLVEVDHDMLVRRFIEKPAADEVTTNLVNAGIYVLEPEVLGMIPEGQEASIEREIFPHLQTEERLRAYVSSSYWKDIGTPRSYLAASHDVLSGAVGAGPDFDYCEVDCSTVTDKGVKLLPPISVAAECVLGQGATVGGRTSLGRGCKIGEEAMVEGSILCDGAEVEPGAVVRGSVIGPRARVRQGTIVRGLSVLGADCVIGEGNILDQGVRINPGVVLPPRSMSF
jgi:mannose-1-phosphate guanylyltransferase